MSFVCLGSGSSAFFVDAQAGNDANNGTSREVPVRTITRAVQLASLCSQIADQQIGLPPVNGNNGRRRFNGNRRRRNGGTNDTEDLIHIPIRIGAGEYNEPALTVPRFVALVGEDREAVTVVTTTLELDQVSSVSSLTLRFVGNEAPAHIHAARPNPDRISHVELHQLHIVIEDLIPTNGISGGRTDSVMQLDDVSADISEVEVSVSSETAEDFTPPAFDGLNGFSTDTDAMINALLGDSTLTSSNFLPGDSTLTSPNFPPGGSAKLRHIIDMRGSHTSISGFSVNWEDSVASDSPGIRSVFHLSEGTNGGSNLDVEDAEVVISTAATGSEYQIVSGTLRGETSEVEINELGVEFSSETPVGFTLVGATPMAGAAEVVFSSGSLYVENAGGMVRGAANPGVAVTLNEFDLGETPRMAQFLQTLAKYNITDDSSTLTTNGGLCLNVRAVSSNYAVREDDYTIVFRNTAPIAVTLPPNPCRGRVLNFVRRGSGSVQIRFGNTVGQLSQRLTLQFFEGEWLVLSRD